MWIHAPGQFLGFVHIRIRVNGTKGNGGNFRIWFKCPKDDNYSRKVHTHGWYVEDRLQLMIEAMHHTSTHSILTLLKTMRHK